MRALTVGALTVSVPTDERLATWELLLLEEMAAFENLSFSERLELVYMAGRVRAGKLWRAPEEAPDSKPVLVAFAPFGGEDKAVVEYGVGYRDLATTCWEIQSVGRFGRWGLTDSSVLGWMPFSEFERP